MSSPKKKIRVKKQAAIVTPENLQLIWNYSDYGRLYKMTYLSCSRASEIRELIAESAIRKNDLVIDQSKTTSEKRLPIDPAMRSLLNSLPSTGYLFPGCFNPNNPVSRAHIHNDLTAITNELGLEGVTTHSFRRSRCTHLYQAGMTPYAITKLSGHKSVNQLMTYIGVEVDEAASQARQIDLQLFGAMV